jgi:hypothetical protein
MCKVRQRIKYLIEMRVKFEVKVRALDHCHDIVSKLGFALKESFRRSVTLTIL